jgi:hypothetical protein
VPDFAFALEIEQRTHLILKRHLAIDSVELKEVDSLQFEPAETSFAGGAQMFGPTVFHPFVRTGSLETGLCGNDEIVRIRMKRFGNKALRDFRAVRVRRVDERDAEFHSASQHRDTFLGVGWLTPNTLSGESHRAKTEPMDEKISPNYEGAASGGGLVCQCGFHYGFSFGFGLDLNVARFF